MSIALVLAIVGMGMDFGSRYVEGQLWMVILGAQAVPYLSALVGAAAWPAGPVASSRGWFAVLWWLCLLMLGWATFGPPSAG